VTWILLLATLGVLGSIGVACRRAHLEADAQLCDYAPAPDEARAALGPRPMTLLLLTGEGGGQGQSGTGIEVAPAGSRRHLRVVGARG
jgi:hypothetical protein